MMSLDSTCSIVIPVYNSQETLPILVQQLLEIMPTISAAFEIILVNDSSRDHSWSVIQGLAQHDDRIVGINLMRNYGQHNALLCGIRAARYEIIITMDDDLQHPPSEIPQLLLPLSQGYDVVYGVPNEQQHGFWRDLSSQITKIALRSAMGAETARNASAFRAFRSAVRDAFAAYQSPYVSVDVLLTWGTTRFTSCKIVSQSRTYGRSNYTFGKLVVHALNMLTGFSTVPLQIASILGLVMTFAGACVFVYVVGRYLILGYSVPGFPFLASIIALFSGAQMFTLGIIGEYLTRMHFRTLDKPAYVVREQLEQASEDN